MLGFRDTMVLETHNVASFKVEVRAESGLIKGIFSGLAPHISLEIDRISHRAHSSKIAVAATQAMANAEESGRFSQR